MEEERRKVYVEVDVTHKTDGTARPRKIKFEDGEVYEIDRVRHCCRAASTKVGWNRASLHGDDMRHGNLPFR